MPSLSGKNALVTGASRGIGRSIALTLAEQGASIAVNYRSRRDEAETVVETIRSSGGTAIAVQADVADEKAVQQMAARSVAELGSVDILVNNAGLLYPGQLLDHQESEFDQMWRTNVKGVVYTSAAVAPGMIERGWGRIINLSSNAALGTSMPGTTLYAATKAAVLALTKRFALELGEHGITVNAVLPGFTKTDMTLGGKDEATQKQVIERVTGLSMLRRVGEPEDIANAVAYLASDASSFMTAQYLMPDGGRFDYITHT